MDVGACKGWIRYRCDQVTAARMIFAMIPLLATTKWKTAAEITHTRKTARVLGIFGMFCSELGRRYTLICPTLSLA